LDSSGPWSPKPARIYANPRVRRRRHAARTPHRYGVSGASARPSRLPENRGVPGSIPGLATFRFLPAIARFCARRPAVSARVGGRLLAFRVQLSVLNGPHSGVEPPTSGDRMATLARSSVRAKVAHRPGDLAGQSPMGGGCSTTPGRGQTTVPRLHGDAAAPSRTSLPQLVRGAARCSAYDEFCDSFLLATDAVAVAVEVVRITPRDPD
jgi:hypothetical protein